MGRKANADRAHAIEHIRVCTKRSGHVEGPKKAREDFQHVAASTWSRWVGDAIGDARYAAGRPAAEQLTAEVARHIPSPSDLAPGFVVEKTALAHDAVRFLRETVADMIADIQLMRDFAAKAGDDGKRKLRVPNVMNDSLRARDRLLNTMLALSEAFYNMDRVERFHEMVVEEIGKESPDTARRIIDRLRALNDQKGAVMLGQW